MPQQVLTQLVTMSNHLGDPVNDFAILGEGNTSAQADAETFYVKASGTELRTMAADGFVRVRFDTILGLLTADDISDEAVKDTFAAASVDAGGKRPSVESLLHALLLQMDDVNFIGHTHAALVNMITCSQDGEQAIRGRLFPDEIVGCGLAPVWVPYTDPGVRLARRVKQEVEAFVDQYEMRPKIILLQNHGLISLGATPAEVEGGTHMMCKTARILLGTYTLGGPHYLTEEQVERIYSRPDEKYRMAILDGKTSPDN